MPTPRRAAAPLDAFVLHHYDWSETSLILDLFTRGRGRLAVAAKGAKRPYSQLRSVLLPFQRVTVTLGRQGEDGEPEVLTLRGAEWAGARAAAGDGAPAGVLPPARLFAAFYLNELVMKLLARADPHPGLFDAYAATLETLSEARGDAGEQVALRAFELVLLREIGLLPELDRVTSTQAPLDVASGVALYRMLGERGVVEAQPRAAGGLSGADLAALQSALAAGDLAALQAACASRIERLKPALRALVHYHLGTPSLRTRDVMREARLLLETRTVPP
jgi:DNA repair protein RecO (recombination protein O)